MSLNYDDLAYINMRLTRIENYIDDMNKHMLEAIDGLESTMIPLVQRFGEMDVQVRQHERFITLLRLRCENARRLSQAIAAQRNNAQPCEII